MITAEGYKELRPQYQTAKRRATELHTKHGDAPVKDCNPSTSVWRLTEAVNALYRRP